MSDELELAPRIVVSRGVLHGQPRVAGTRVMVHQVLELLGAGKSMEQVVSDDYFPELTLEDVRACIAYASRVIADDTLIQTT
jgi:uncharacterized protein (DUF433 family)